MRTPPLIVHFGAGNIGRSLVGTLFSRAGYEILFVDAAPDIVVALRQRLLAELGVEESVRRAA